ELVALPEAVIRDGVNRSKTPKLETTIEKKVVTEEKEKPSSLTRLERLEELILGFVAWRDSGDKAMENLVRNRWGEELFINRQNELRDRISEQILVAEITYGTATDPPIVLTGLLHEWQIENWRIELTETVGLIKSLNSQTEPKLLDQYLKRCQELSQFLNNKL
ncbi:MAG: hypothetical protein AABY11_02225, partial [archaeon]